MSIRLFEDSNHAKLYNQFRPTVPDVVINDILHFLKEKIDPKDWDIAVDVGCGSGQATNKLSKHFRHCYGTDVSEAQINVAKESKHSNNISFNVCSAEDMPQIGTNSVQLLTAISAAHWFKLQQFFKECDRILVDNGVIALSARNNITITDPLKPTDNDLNQVFSDHYLDKRLIPYKNPNINITQNAYKDLEFPKNYDYVYKTDLNVSHSITANDLIGWYQTLSHFQAFSFAEKRLSEEFINEFTAKLKAVLKTDDLSTKEVTISYTYFIAMGRKVNRNALYQTFRGCKVSLQCKYEALEYAFNYKPTELDRIAITYPKCGTFWSHELIQLVINSGRLESKDRETFQKNWLELHGQEVWAKIASVSANRESDDVIPLRTHLCYELLPYNKSAKYLLLIRNPKDICVSAYHMYKHFDIFGSDFHNFFKVWIKGDIQCGDYFDYVKQYWIHCKNENNFSILVYEEMLRDIKPCIETIAQFLGQKYVDRLSSDERIIDDIILNSTFQSMKDNHSMTHHLRKGTVGDWRSHLSKDESDLIDKRVEEEWKGTGLELLWKEEMKWTSD